eukprot:gene1157-619_t
MVKLYNGCLTRFVSDGKIASEVLNDQREIVPYLTVFDAKRTLQHMLTYIEDNVMALRKFVENGWVDVNDSLTELQNTPLHISAWCGSLRCVRYLLGRSDCDVNAANIDGKTPLHYALLSALYDIGDFEQVLEELLSDCRVLLLARNSDNGTVGDMAIGDSVYELIDEERRRCVKALLRGEKKRRNTYDHCLMHIATRAQPDKNELIQVFQDSVRPYLAESAFTAGQHERIAKVTDEIDEEEDESDEEEDESDEHEDESDENEDEQ